ncbi:uncharacterized protein KY384_007378 [Bacidia gigantensis]|uniref:uncharacterized protein n=1 Tax=Bacidia gigantensis TaxID=2732470 RepID=UPI001D04BF42|nr:uncharacterized protein KY384_007378 [Bacidia gigantensis]KAG8528460.1 hypothetical protein KY384_007378 [Bacidia gigantensis]
MENPVQGSYHTPDRVVAAWTTLSHRAEAIRQRCVSPFGVGGWGRIGKFLLHHGQPYLLPSAICLQDQTTNQPIHTLTNVPPGEGSNEGNHEIYPLAITLSGPNSKFSNFLSINYACATDYSGNDICNPTSPAPDHKPNPPPSDSDKILEGSSCGADTDCTSANLAKNNLICALEIDAPMISPAFKSAVCTYIPNVAAMIAAGTLMAKEFVGRRRLLDDANGTISALKTPTSPGIGVLEGLYCPCNCTYCSSGCCMSATKLVFDEGLGVGSAVGVGNGTGVNVAREMTAPNASVCCDEATGAWRNDTVLRDQAGKWRACKEVGEGGSSINF